MFKCILFIFNTEKVFYELEQKRKKEEARKAPKNEMRYTEIPKKEEPKPEENVRQTEMISMKKKPNNNP